MELWSVQIYGGMRFGYCEAGSGMRFCEKRSERRGDV